MGQLPVVRGGAGAAAQGDGELTPAWLLRRQTHCASMTV